MSYRFRFTRIASNSPISSDERAYHDQRPPADYRPAAVYSLYSRTLTYTLADSQSCSQSHRIARISVDRRRAAASCAGCGLGLHTHTCRHRTSSSSGSQARCNMLHTRPAPSTTSACVVDPIGALPSLGSRGRGDARRASRRGRATVHGLRQLRHFEVGRPLPKVRPWRGAVHRQVDEILVGEWRVLGRRGADPIAIQ